VQFVFKVLFSDSAFFFWYFIFNTFSEEDIIKALFTAYIFYWITGCNGLLRGDCVLPVSHSFSINVANRSRQPWN